MLKNDYIHAEFGAGTAKEREHRVKHKKCVSATERMMTVEVEAGCGDQRQQEREIP